MANPRIWDGVAADNGFATATNWSSDTTPITGDTAIIPGLAASSTKNIAGSNQSAILLAAFWVEPECKLNFGSRETYLQLDADYVYYYGEGTGYLQIANSTEIWVGAGAAASSGNSYGVNLLGTANALLVLDPGESNSVAVAAMGGETAAFTTILITTGEITLGASVTMTTLTVDGGTVTNSSDVTTLNLNGGTFRQQKNNPTTINATGGRLYYNSADVPTTVNLRKGSVLDASEDGRAKTGWSATTVNLYEGATIYDPGNVLMQYIGTLNILDGGTLAVS